MHSTAQERFYTIMGFLLANYEDIEPDDKQVQYLWQALEGFTDAERSQFLRFVSGRKRLPTQMHISSEKL